MRIRDWSSDVCSSDLQDSDQTEQTQEAGADTGGLGEIIVTAQKRSESLQKVPISIAAFDTAKLDGAGISDTQMLQAAVPGLVATNTGSITRSEEHTSELQSLMRISYAVFCLKKKNISKHPNPNLNA